MSLKANNQQKKAPPGHVLSEVEGTGGVGVVVKQKKTIKSTAVIPAILLLAFGLTVFGTLANASDTGLPTNSCDSPCTAKSLVSGGLYSNLDTIKNYLATPDPANGGKKIDIIDYENPLAFPWSILPPELGQNNSKWKAEFQNDGKKIECLYQIECKFIPAPPLTKPTPPRGLKDLNLDGATDATDYVISVYLKADGASDFTKLPPDQINEITEISNAIRYKGEAQLNAGIRDIAKTMRNVMGGMAILWMIISGMRMSFSQGDEHEIEDQKNSIKYTIAALVIVVLLEQIIRVLYGPPGMEKSITDLSSSGFSSEILGLIAYFKILIGAMAVFFIILSGVRTIAASGEEQELTKQHTAIFWVIIGLVVLMIDQFVVSNVFNVTAKSTEILESMDTVCTAATEADPKTRKCRTDLNPPQTCKPTCSVLVNGQLVSSVPGLYGRVCTVDTDCNQNLLETCASERSICDPPIPPDQQTGLTPGAVANLINLFAKIANFLLGFVGLIAFAALIFGGGTMIANFGDDEAIEKGKKYVKNALIGIIVILSAFAIINTVII